MIKINFKRESCISFFYGIGKMLKNSTIVLCKILEKYVKIVYNTNDKKLNFVVYGNKVKIKPDFRHNKNLKA